MDVEDFKTLLSEWVGHSWLHGLDFDCEDRFINEAIVNFETDYLRWFPNDSAIDTYKLKTTPQLISMLLYRVSRVLYISNLDGRRGGKRFLFSSCKTYWSD